jgi:hypothetical protein
METKINILSHRDTFNCKLKNKKQLDLMKELLIGTEDEVATNPFSKEKCTLNPEAIALYDFMMGSQISGFTNQENIYKFYLAQEIFRANWPEEYMALID